jgi:hypothetical protein
MGRQNEELLLLTFRSSINSHAITRDGRIESFRYKMKLAMPIEVRVKWIGILTKKLVVASIINQVQEISITLNFLPAWSIEPFGLQPFSRQKTYYHFENELQIEYLMCTLFIY